MAIKMYKKILLATDGSKESSRAVARIVDLVKGTKAEVLVFHSIEHHNIEKVVIGNAEFGNPVYEFNQEQYVTIQKRFEQEGNNIINKAKSIIEENGIKVEGRLISGEKPEDYIIHIVPEEHFDLVVLGSKGQHSRLRELLLGSITESVVNHINCDVLIVR